MGTEKAQTEREGTHAEPRRRGGRHFRFLPRNGRGEGNLFFEQFSRDCANWTDYGAKNTKMNRERGVQLEAGEASTDATETQCTSGANRPSFSRPFGTRTISSKTRRWKRRAILSGLSGAGPQPSLGSIYEPIENSSRFLENFSSEEICRAPQTTGRQIFGGWSFGLAGAVRSFKLSFRKRRIIFIVS